MSVEESPRRCVSAVKHRRRRFRKKWPARRVYAIVRNENAGSRAQKMSCCERFEVHLLEPDTMSYSAATEDSEKTTESRTWFKALGRPLLEPTRARVASSAAAAGAELGRGVPRASLGPRELRGKRIEGPRGMFSTFPQANCQEAKRSGLLTAAVFRASPPGAPPMCPSTHRGPGREPHVARFGSNAICCTRELPMQRNSLLI